MFANGLALFMLLWLALPGLWLARKPWAMSPSLWFLALMIHLAVFAGLGLIFKMLPWMIDPRFHL